MIGAVRASSSLARHRASARRIAQLRPARGVQARRRADAARRCAWRSASSPSPLRALTKTRGTRTPRGQLDRVDAARAAAAVGVEAVELVEHQHLRHVGGADLASTRCTSAICSASSGLAASTTCSSRSASTASCSVAWNASTSLCGRSRMKPTVSDSETDAADAVEVQLARGGVERGEQLVGGVGVGLDQRVEQRRLAGVGVADQRDAEGAACARARGAACCAGA